MFPRAPKTQAVFPAQPRNERKKRTNKTTKASRLDDSIGNTPTETNQPTQLACSIIIIIMEDFEDDIDDLIADAQDYDEDTMMEEDASGQPEPCDDEEKDNQQQPSPPVPMGQPEPYDEEEHDDALDEPTVPEQVEAPAAVRQQFARARATPKSDIFKFERYEALLFSGGFFATHHTADPFNYICITHSLTPFFHQLYQSRQLETRRECGTRHDEGQAVRH
jgi:hypothetical protein